MLELCYTHFAVLHASGTLTPLWSAEYLTARMASGGDKIGRRDKFHAEVALLNSDRATPSDYRNSGFDKGHLTPADDMPTYDEQAETYTMANMVPQAPYLNQHLWATLEGSLHMLAEMNGELYIVTGPIFTANPRRIKGRVAVPVGIFKAVYDPTTQNVIVFYAANQNDARCQIISLDDLEQRSGVVPFPSISAGSRAAVSNRWNLPNTNRGVSPPSCD